MPVIRSFFFHEAFWLRKGGEKNTYGRKKISVRGEFFFCQVGKKFPSGRSKIFVKREIFFCTVGEKSEDMGLFEKSNFAPIFVELFFENPLSFGK
jgi:hypothetical protein